MTTATATPASRTDISQADAAGARGQSLGSATPLLRRFSVDEYHKLINDGFFARDEQYELLDGLIVRKMSRDPIHDACLAMARRLLEGRVPAGFHMRVQSAVTTVDSEPEPDLAIVRGGEFAYAERHPGAPDTVLLVELANSSVGGDRSWKGSIYAKAGFPLYWLINIANRRVEVYSDPSGPDEAPAFRRREDFTIGQLLTLAIDGQTLAPIAVAELFPPKN